MASKKIEIKSRWDGSVLYVAKGAADVKVALEEAVERGANLRGANLRDANLGGANLGGANLRDAKGLNPHAVNDLLILTHQVGKIRAYKLVTTEGYGPFNGGIKYEVGQTYEVKNADCNAETQCGPGINLATLPWCIQNWQAGHRILLAEFTAKDIAAIPVGDGKFRTHRCKIVRELDLKEIGVIEGAVQ